MKSYNMNYKKRQTDKYPLITTDDEEYDNNIDNNKFKFADDNSFYTNTLNKNIHKPKERSLISCINFNNTCSNFTNTSLNEFEKMERLTYSSISKGRNVGQKALQNNMKNSKNKRINSVINDTKKDYLQENINDKYNFKKNLSSYEINLQNNINHKNDKIIIRENNLSCNYLNNNNSFYINQENSKQMSNENIQRNRINSRNFDENENNLNYNKFSEMNDYNYNSNLNFPTNSKEFEVLNKTYITNKTKESKLSNDNERNKKIIFQNKSNFDFRSGSGTGSLLICNENIKILENNENKFQDIEKIKNSNSIDDINSYLSSSNEKLKFETNVLKKMFLNRTYKLSKETSNNVCDEKQSIIYSKKIIRKKQKIPKLNINNILNFEDKETLLSFNPAKGNNKNNKNNNVEDNDIHQNNIKHFDIENLNQEKDKKTSICSNQSLLINFSLSNTHRQESIKDNPKVESNIVERIKKIKSMNFLNNNENIKNIDNSISSMNKSTLNIKQVNKSNNYSSDILYPVQKLDNMDMINYTYNNLRKKYKLFEVNDIFKNSYLKLNRQLTMSMNTNIFGKK